MESAKAHILVADDNAGHRDLVAELLQRAGYAVSAAADGGAVLTFLETRDCDLILLDIGMPAMDGLQTVAKIRALPPPRDRVPVIAVTAHAMPGDRERFLAAGMDDYLSKPMTASALLSTVSRWLDPVATPPIASADHMAGLPVIDWSALDRLAEQTDPSILPSLVATYLTEVGNRRIRMADGLSRRDWNVLEREAHALKSASHSFGAVRLAELLEAIEQACVRGDTESAAALAATLPGIVDAVTRALAARS